MNAWIDCRSMSIKYAKNIETELQRYASISIPLSVSPRSSQTVEPFSLTTPGSGRERLPDPASAHQPDIAQSAASSGAFWRIAEGHLSNITATVPEDEPPFSALNCGEQAGEQITQQGKSYIWRRGSHKNRVSAPGGDFGLGERQRQYETNKQRYHAARAVGTDSATDPRPSGAQ
ncbi:hypothetical protein [Candidatus Amarolinea dominans]|uniref:hypothetical protein n=1 Tax=Candidatus Amarolinea dominans TaxID=3140696 RepID=UPI003134FCFD|nr:hypothetical protein [Anaerolineae bacterium]